MTTGMGAWLKAYAIALIVLGSACVGGIYGLGYYIANSETQVLLIRQTIAEEAAKVRVLQNDIKSIDGRINDLKTRLDVIDELSRYAAQRSLQSPLPLPSGTRR